MFKVFLLLAATSLSQNLFAGNEGRDGGDTVVCAKSNENTFEGYYNLDYLATYRSKNNNEDVKTPESAEASLDRMIALFRSRQMLDAAASLNEFRRNLTNEDFYTQPFVWEQGSFGLIVLKKKDKEYQLLDRFLPKNCYKPAANGENEIDLIRTVTRSKRNGTTILAYHNETKQKLDPLQLSFLYVHEWLREFTNDETFIRRVNRLLHSDKLLDEGDISHALANAGIDFFEIPFPGFIPVCDRGIAIRNMIEATYSKLCSEFTANDLAGFVVMNLRSHNLKQIIPGDFSGIRPIEIDLRDNLIQTLPKGAFYHLNFALKTGGLNLARNRIKFIKRGAFKAVTNALTVDISFNGLETIDNFAFDGLQTFNLYLANNKLASFYPETFVGLAARTINLSHNEIHSLGRFDERLKFFSHVEGLKRLDLSRNKLEVIHEGAIGVLTLEELDLSDNELKNVPSEVVEIARNDKFKKLDLRNNPLSDETKKSLKKEFGDKVDL